MKKTLALAVLALAFTVAISAGADARRHCRNGDDWMFRDKTIELEDGSLVIEHEDEGWTVEITEDYKLYVDGERVKTDRHQKNLLKRYYEDYEDIQEMAEEIGREAAKIGVAGAKIGVSAVACVARLLLDEYDSDVDIDIDVEIDKEKIEKMAEKLEKKADRIEDLADDLKKTHKKLRKAIPELGELEDF